MTFDSPIIAAKISTALLRYRGEITEDEIKAIPFVTEAEADLIIKEILDNLDVEVITRKTRTKPFLEWTKVIRLKSG